ncbi:MAG: rod shape-determining protein MreD [Bacteroidales bacterium]|nr:rod shape-determining protein MreD [Bacteroidales bacterium]MBS3773757.1 rod shape-determining protein MreD [Bacteroidales bacterium]
MINYLPRYILTFVILVLVQVLLMNNIQLGGYLNPYIYVLFLLSLPFETPKWGLLVLGFLLGLTIDLFSHTVGMHTSACVFMAFLRPMVLGTLEPRDGYEPDTYPSVRDYGLNWYFKYSSILILAHHLFLFYIEMFKLDNFFHTLSRALLSGLLSLIFILIIKVFIKK